MEDDMQATGVTVNLPVADIEAAREFYGGYLGLTSEGFNMGWVASLATPDGRAGVHVVTHDATAPEDSIASISVDDIDAAYRQARDRGYEIVHPLTTEPWGLRRFFVRDPDGNLLNINSHPA